MIEKKALQTDLAPQAIGPYSQAVVCNSMVYCSGQLGIDPTTKEFISDSDVKLQTHQIMKNIQSILRTQKISLNHIIKTVIYLSDMNNFSLVNSAYKEYFTTPYPARSTVEVSYLPLGALVEIEVIATLNH
jgi:2-iminobutanoate/2-iminopropanoate deaminase